MRIGRKTEHPLKISSKFESHSVIFTFLIKEIFNSKQVFILGERDSSTANHNYRKCVKMWSFKSVEVKLKKLEKNNPHKGHGLLRLFKCLTLQFMENLSEREKGALQKDSQKAICGIYGSNLL